MAEDIPRQARTLTVVALAFMGSIGVYVLVAYFSTRVPPARPPVALPGLLLACAVMAPVSAALGFFLRRLFLEWRGPRTGQRYFAAVMVGLACFEASMIWALIALFQTLELAWALGGAALSLTCMALTFPRREALERYLESPKR